MNPVIKIEIKSVYGKETVYCVSEQKESLQGLTGHTTLTRADMQYLKALGFSFEVIAAKVWDAVPV
jgi:hypothetical protein